MAKGKFERAPEPWRKPVARHSAGKGGAFARGKAPDSRREQPRPAEQPAHTPRRAEQSVAVEQPKRTARPVPAEPPKPAAQPRFSEQPRHTEAPAEAAPEKRTFFTVIRDIFVGLIGLFAVGMMIFTVVSVTTLDRSERSILGYRAFIVLSDSMSATDFDAGDVVLVKPVDPETLQPGDIISFTSKNTSNFGQIVTHKIRALTTDEDGNPAFITYGTTTDTDDETTVSYSAVLGKYWRSLPKVGFFFQYLRTGPGYILFILVPFGLLILFQGLRSVRLFQQEKKEARDEMEAERAQMAAEREETRRLLAELKQMQSQLHENQS